MSDSCQDVFNLPDLPEGADYRRVTIDGEWDGVSYIADEGFCRVRYEGKVYRNRVKTRASSE